VLQVCGFVLLAAAIRAASVPGLLITLAIVVAGFAIMMPSLQSLLSRRSDPQKQGSVLGVGQSVSALARILGPAVGIPILKLNAVAPYLAAAMLMIVALLLVRIAMRRGGDYADHPMPAAMNHP
jgi:MFS family permease